MLDQMLATFTEGAVIYLGVPLLLKLCRGIFGSVTQELDMHFGKCALLKNISIKRGVADSARTQEGVVFRHAELQSESSSSVAPIQRYYGFALNYTNNSPYTFGWSRCVMNKTKSDNSQKEDLTPFVLHNMNGSAFVNLSLEHTMLKSEYHHFKEETMLADDMQITCDWSTNMTTVMHTILKEKSDHPKRRESLVEEDCTMQSLEIFPNDMCDMDEISISDCVYNHKGQLVCMYICFNVAHSDTSSVTSSDNSACDSSDLDSEDFIVFENTCTAEDQHCPRLDFVCNMFELQEDTCTNSSVITSDLHYDTAKMDCFDTKLDAFVQEIVQPNLNCDELVFKRNSCKERCKSSDIFISTTSSGRTKCKESKKKKVQFMPDDQLVTIHPLFVWNFAYRQARKGTWEADALDRLRFQRRVTELDGILAPVLLAKREKISQLGVTCCK